MSEPNSPISLSEARTADNLSSSMEGEDSNQVSSTPRSKRLSERSKKRTVVHNENVIASTSSASGSRSATVLLASSSSSTTSTRRPRGRPRSGTVDSPAAVFSTATTTSNLEAVSNLPDLHELSDLVVLEVSSNKSSSNKSVDSCAIIDISKEDDDCLIIGSTRRRRLSNPANGSITIILDDDLPSSSTASTVTNNLPDALSRKKSKKTHHSSQAETIETPADNPNLPHCPICLENLTEIRQHNKQLMTTLCGHIVCNLCLNEHFKTTPGAKTINCPTCRTKLTKSKIHALYL